MVSSRQHPPAHTHTYTHTQLKTRQKIEEKIDPSPAQVRETPIINFQEPGRGLCQNTGKYAKNRVAADSNGALV